jgi:multicomponent Na+:H+ antiporter subunit A
MNVRTSPILDELLDRWLTKVIIIVSIYITFRGHNAPGGGFAGGLVMSGAFVLQYLSGRTPHVRNRPIRRPSLALGSGLLLALLPTVAPLTVGAAPLESHIWKLDVPAIGEVKFVSSTVFDLGVHLVVVSVVLMILLSLGARGELLLDEDGTGAENSDGGTHP